MEIEQVTYAESRQEFFENQLASANRKLDWAVKHNPDPWECAEKGEVVSFYQDAIEALHAQQERENPKPCEYCDSNSTKYVYVSEAMEPRIFFDVCGANIRFFDEQFEGGFCDLFTIHFCPMCGRKLEKEAR